MSVSLKDIARKTGYSLTTVSRVMHRKGEISAETRRKILQTAEQLGYHENRLVTGILSGKSHTAGLVLDWTNPFFAAVGAAVMDTLMEHDILTVTPRPVGYLFDKGNTDRELIHRLIEQRVDGIIIMLRNDLADDNYFRDVASKCVPVISIDRKTNASIDFVGTDDFAGGRIAAEHLYSIGRRNIGYLGGPDYASTARLRREGMESFASEHPDMRLICITEPAQGSQYGHIEQFLDDHPELDALAAFHDRIAVAAGQHLLKKGLRIPEDIALIGFGNLASGYQELFPLTTMNQHPEQIGRKAAERLLLRIQSDLKYPPEDFRIIPSLEIKSTSIKL